MLEVLLWTLAVCNAMILSANVYRVWGPNKKVQYSTYHFLTVNTKHVHNV